VKTPLRQNREQTPFTPIEQTILGYMTTEPIHIDALAAASGIDISPLLVHLFELELKTAVIQQPGQFFQKRIF
ncbi:MAG: DNA-protecting protein DprA, partial [Chlorobiaceae bacterium]|nr:DNA-protecting protein DprA [Chlorobiaceae bacterium]